MNYMNEVAKLLGVELGEEFYIKEHLDIKCTLYNDGLSVYPVKDSICTLPSSYATLYRLLQGTITIKRKPWNPKVDEFYWLVRPDGEMSYTRWCNSALDFSLYKIGNCYQTKAEAVANRDKWVAFYASDEVLEV